MTPEFFRGSLPCFHGCRALAEIGDKTQLLVLALAVSFRKRVAIILGIAVATVLNHTLAVALGAWLAFTISPRSLR